MCLKLLDSILWLWYQGRSVYISANWNAKTTRTGDNDNWHALELNFTTLKIHISYFGSNFQFQSSYTFRFVRFGFQLSLFWILDSNCQFSCLCIFCILDSNCQFSYILLHFAFFILDSNCQFCVLSSGRQFSAFAFWVPIVNFLIFLYFAFWTPIANLHWMATNHDENSLFIGNLKAGFEGRHFLLRGQMLPTDWSPWHH